MKVTLELTSQELVDHESGPLVRCQKCKRWIPLADYYSELQGSLLPLVGNARCHAEDVEEWYDSGEKFLNPYTNKMEPLMKKKTSKGCGWSETVRIVQKDMTPPEGGVLEIKVHDGLTMKDKMV